MKKQFRILSLVILTGLLAFTSCNKDDNDDDTAYIGTWQLSESGRSQTMVFTASTFTSTTKITINGQELTLMTTEGNLSVDGSSMVITFTKVTNYLDFSLGGPPQPLDAPVVLTEAQAIMSSMEIASTTINGTYSINGDEITIKSDMNGDGEYLEDEIQVFTKV